MLKTERKERSENVGKFIIYNYWINTTKSINYVTRIGEGSIETNITTLREELQNTTAF